MQITIRAMELRDIPAVARLDNAAFAVDSWSEQSFRKELLENRLAHYYILQTDAGALVGSLGCWAIVDEVHIVTIAVHPDAQRQGLGEVLLLQAFELAQQIRADAITLECRESNAAARALYAKYDFAVAGRRRAYYPDGEDALILSAQGIGADSQRRRRELRDALRERGLRVRHQGKSERS